MPPKKKTYIGKVTERSRKMKIRRAEEAPYNREIRLKKNSDRNSEARAGESSNIREIRIEADRLRKREARATESPINRQIRLQGNRIRTQASRSMLGDNLNMEAINYKKNYDYRYIRYYYFFMIKGKSDLYFIFLITTVSIQLFKLVKWTPNVHIVTQRNSKVKHPACVVLMEKYFWSH